MKRTIKGFSSGCFTVLSRDWREECEKCTPATREEGRGVFAGARAGRAMLGRLLERVGNDPQEPKLLLLDFEGVEIATASFLRESVVEFRDVVRRRWVNCYPVVANANESIEEELSVLIRPNRDVLILCCVDRNGRTRSPRLIGELEPKQRIAFDLVGELGEAGAGELKSADDTEGVTQTAWNNRLAALSRLGLLMEISQGRSKRYRPLPLGE